MAAVIVVLLVGGALATGWQAIRATVAEEEARRQRDVALANEQAAQENERTAQQERDEARRQRAKAQRNLYFSHMHLAKRAWDDADVRGAFNLLEEHMAPEGPNES